MTEKDRVSKVLNVDIDYEFDNMGFLSFKLGSVMRTPCNVQRRIANGAPSCRGVVRRYLAGKHVCDLGDPYPLTLIKWKWSYNRTKKGRFILGVISIKWWFLK